MSRPLIQHGDEVREMNDDEFERYQTIIADNERLEAAAAVRDQARQSARAKLAALGLTDTEIAALVGG